MTFLKRVLIADAAISGTTGLLMLFAAVPLQEFLGLPVTLLRVAGASLLPFALFLVALSRRDSVPRAAVLSVIVANIAWIASSLALLFVDQVDLNRLGVAFILAQAAAVAVFAEMQYIGLRRATA